MNSMKHRFSNGPQVGIEFQNLNGEGFTSRLFLSTEFTVLGAAPHLLEWCAAYAQKQPIHKEFNIGSGFQQAILLELQRVGFGQTVSYQSLGQRAGFKNHARAVGQAVHRNPCPLLIPCHRVIQANGSIGGFALDLEIKRRLLEFERMQSDT